VTVRQLRLVVTVEDYDRAVAFYRDELGMPEEMAYASADGRIVILDAGRATLELTDAHHAAFIDQVEVGRRVAGPIRVALQVEDTASMTDRLVTAGAELIAPPVRTPWRSLNARIAGPDLQLTLFQEPADGNAPPG
jgi:lactoylglutathione lyase